MVVGTGWLMVVGEGVVVGEGCSQTAFFYSKAASVLLVKLKKHWVGVVASEILA